MSVNNTVTLHRATDVGVRWQNVIGQKEIQIFPSGQGAILTAGSTIPLSHDVSDSSVNAFLNSLGPLLASINPQQANEFVENVSGALEGDTAEINQLINSGATIANTVGALDSQVGAVITNLDQVLTAISSRSGDLGTLIDNLQTVASSLASKNDLLDSVVSNLSGVASDLATLIGSNQSVLTSTIDNLKAVAGDVQNNQQHLASSLSSLGAGLAPYIQISNYGQWFAIQTIYTCLDNQTSCTYYEPADPPPGSGLLGGLPSSGADKTSSLGSALKQRSVARARRPPRPLPRPRLPRPRLPRPRLPRPRLPRPPPRRRRAAHEVLHRAPPQGHRRHRRRHHFGCRLRHPLAQAQRLHLGVHRHGSLLVRRGDRQGFRCHGGRGQGRLGHRGDGARQRGRHDPVGQPLGPAAPRDHGGH
jgi:virulence factor Mce-like protein